MTYNNSEETKKNLISPNQELFRKFSLLFLEYQTTTVTTTTKAATTTTTSSYCNRISVIVALKVNSLSLKIILLPSYVLQL